MHRGVGSNQWKDASSDTNECTATKTMPAGVGEPAKDSSGVATRSKHPERNNNTNEGTDVDDENDALDKGQLPGQDSIEQHRKQRDGYHEKGTMPSLEYISWIIQHQ